MEKKKWLAKLANFPTSVVTTLVKVEFNRIWKCKNCQIFDFTLWNPKKYYCSLNPLQLFKAKKFPNEDPRHSPDYFCGPNPKSRFGLPCSPNMPWVFFTVIYFEIWEFNFWIFHTSKAKYFPIIYFFSSINNPFLQNNIEPLQGQCLNQILTTQSDKLMPLENISHFLCSQKKSRWGGGRT